MIDNSIYAEALTRLVKRHHEDGAMGILVLGLPGDISVKRSLLSLGGPGDVWATLISPPNPDELQTWAEAEGWERGHFVASEDPTEGATHAVDQRNADPEGAIRLVIAWEEQNRLHSLENRGYEIFGPDELAEQIAVMGEEGAENTPRENLWAALSSNEVMQYLSLEGIRDYYCQVFSLDPSERADAYRSALTALGLLRDDELLSGSFKSEKAIRRRLRKNYEVLGRIKEGDSKDKQRAHKNTENDPSLRDAYDTYLRIKRWPNSAVEGLTLREAEALVRSVPSSESEEDSGDDEEEVEETPGLVQYDDATDAAIDLLCDGREDDVRQSLDSILNILNETSQDESDEVETEDFSFGFEQDERARSLTQNLIGEKTFGGWIEADDPLKEISNKTGRVIDDFNKFDDVYIGKLKAHLKRAGEFAPGFNGSRYLEEYLNSRRVLTERVSSDYDLRHADVFSSQEAALSYLIAFEEVERAANKVVAAYRELFTHLREQYTNLADSTGPEGARRLYKRLLKLDAILLDGSQDRAAILSPIHPLVLWKHTELIRTIREEREEMTPEDVDLLRSEVKGLPEPLFSFYAPAQEGSGGDDLVYSGRFGGLPIYQSYVSETADVSRETLRRACEKLSVLYPPAKTTIRIVSVNPRDLEPVSKAAKALLKDKFRRVDLRVALLDQDSDKTIHPPSELDEYHAEGRFSITRLQVGTVRELEQELESRPAHLLVLSGEQERNSSAVEQETSRLHPLSVPSQIESNPIDREITLQPRSNQAEGDSNHPFGLYSDIVSAVSGRSRDRTVRRHRRTAVGERLSLLDHCQFCAVAGAPDPESSLSAMILTQGGGSREDTVVSSHEDRILSGIEDQIRNLNYVPDKDNVGRLLREIQALGGNGIFNLISEEGDHGFSKSAVKGQLGLSVALRWYRENVAGGRQESVILSLDSFSARQWLRGRDSRQRTDLLAFREGESSPQVDLIEVKSYSATSEEGVEDSYAAQQLRSVARTLLPILQSEGQGSLLTDRRRELLRRHVYQEGLLNSLASGKYADPSWVETLNEVIDGDRNLIPDLMVLEVKMGSNRSVEQDTLPALDPGSSDPIASKGPRRVRLGEKSIRPFLEGGEIPEAEGGMAEDEEVQEAESQEADDASAEKTHETASSGPEGAGPKGGTGGTSVSKDGGVESSEKENSQPGTEDSLFGFDASSEGGESVEERSKDVYRALDDIGVSLRGAIDPNLVEVGPSVIRFKARLQPGEKVSDVQRRTKDLMRELKLSKKPMVDNLPGTDLIYIDLPRESRQFARLSSVLGHHNSPELGPYSIPAGVTPAGEVEWINLPELPHMLVAGSTGSGKSMFLYSLIASLAHYCAPEDLDMVLVDPKRTDFILFSRLPHLRNGEIIEDAEDAVRELTSLINSEVERRTDTLQENLHKDIYSYNESNPEDRISPIFVFIDEFAELSDVLKGGDQEEEFHDALQRLAQRARNVGIHLIVATQRPTADVISGNVKANLPCRVSFQLGSGTDSRTILDASGAESLLGNGDMLLRKKGNEVKRLQGLYLPEEEIRKRFT